MRLERNIAIDQESLCAYLLEVRHLPHWTVHRALFVENAQWYEIRRQPDGDRAMFAQALNVSRLPHDDGGCSIVFEWQGGNRVAFQIAKTANGCCVQVFLPAGLPSAKATLMQQLLTMELDILQAILEQGETSGLASIPASHWIFLQNYHLNMYL